MAIAFGLGGVAYWLLGSLGHAPWAFVIFAALIFLTWGEIFSLFPSTCTDTFGPKFATVNLSLLYTAKGTSAFLVPVANLIKDATGSWHMVFVVTAIMNFVVVALALFVLKPMRARAMAQGLKDPGSSRSSKSMQREAASRGGLFALEPVNASFSLWHNVLQCARSAARNATQSFKDRVRLGL